MPSQDVVEGACLLKASCRSWRLVECVGVLSCFAIASCRGSVPVESVLQVLASCCVLRSRLVEGACLLKASCRSWRLVECVGVLSCFAIASCRGACLLKASCRSWGLVVFCDRVLSREHAC